jgi:transcriptional regulator of acetoin/glycerol metabolism
MKPLREAEHDFRRAYLREAFEAARGNMTQMARLMGVHRSHAHRMCRRYGIERRQWGNAAWQSLRH